MKMKKIQEALTAALRQNVPVAQVPVAPAPVSLIDWSKWISPILTIAIGAITVFASLSITTSRLDERMRIFDGQLKDKANALVVQNLINTSNDEIEKLRERVIALVNDHGKFSTANANLTALTNSFVNEALNLKVQVARLENSNANLTTLLNKLANEVEDLCKRVTKIETKVESVDLVAIRERLARVEALLKKEK